MCGIMEMLCNRRVDRVNPLNNIKGVEITARISSLSIVWKEYARFVNDCIKWTTSNISCGQQEGFRKGEQTWRKKINAFTAFIV